MTTTTIQNPTAEFGLSRMDDAEYEHEYRNAAAAAAAAEGGLVVGTPRPGTSDADNEAAAHAAATAKAIHVWSFSQAAKQHAAEVKRRRSPKSRNIYRMGVNTRVRNALELLKKKLDDTRVVHQLTPRMTEEEFNLLRQGIENFRVKIIVDDSVTLNELREMRQKNLTEMEKAALETQSAFVQYQDYCHPSYIAAKERHGDLMMWNSALTEEIRRNGVPSQHAQISPNDSGIALRNILSASTIRRKFTSINSLTMTIRQELVTFLVDDARANDRDEVVNQIKEACIAAAAAKKMKQKQQQ
jgi:hypothetical protein